MPLLDLPPEMLARIVTHLVTSAGIVEAWKCRKACRTLRKAVEFEVLASQPTRAFLRSKDGNARGILRKNMALYLSYRTVSNKDAYGFLPRFMGKVLDVVCSGVTEDYHKTRVKRARTLCELVIEGRDDLVWQLTTIKNPERSTRCKDSMDVFLEDLPSTDIAAAAAVGDLAALQKALGNDADKIWEKSPLFGHPLVLAAACGSVDIVGAVVKHLKSIQRRTRLVNHTDVLSHAIEVALKEEHTDVALLLLQTYHTEAPSKWMLYAVQTRSRDVITRVRQLEYVDGASEEFEEACSTGDLTTVRMFIDEGLVSLGRRYVDNDQYTPIQIAVDVRSTAAVKLLLEMGSDPNGEFVENDKSRPLWIAIQNVDREIIDLLLKFGADPRLVQKLWDDMTDEFKSCRPGIWFALSEAERASKFYVRPCEPITALIANAPDLFLPE